MLEVRIKRLELMKITQQKLAAQVDGIFKEGILQIQNLIFKQFHFFDTETKKKHLQAIYQDSLTTDYSFEEWNTSISEVVNLFIEAPLEKQRTHFIVYDKNNILLGRCNLRVYGEKINFGYALCVNKQNQGFGTQILRALLYICFDELQLLQDIFGSTMSHNIASQKTMEKVGMIANGCIEKTMERALDTRWLEYKINYRIYKAQASSSRHPGARNLREVILSDYKMSRKEGRRYNSSELGRIHFFLKKEVFLAPPKEDSKVISAQLAHV